MPLALISPSAFRNYRHYMFVFIYLGLSLSLAVLSVLLPTIITTLRYASVEANLITAPVYASAYIYLLVTVRLSDPTRMRGVPIALGWVYRSDRIRPTRPLT